VLNFELVSLSCHCILMYALYIYKYISLYVLPHRWVITVVHRLLAYLPWKKGLATPMTETRKAYKDSTVYKFFHDWISDLPLIIVSVVKINFLLVRLHQNCRFHKTILHFRKGFMFNLVENGQSCIKKNCVTNINTFFKTFFRYVTRDKCIDKIKIATLKYNLCPISNSLKFCQRVKKEIIVKPIGPWLEYKNKDTKRVNLDSREKENKRHQTNFLVLFQFSITSVILWSLLLSYEIPKKNVSDSFYFTGEFQSIAYTYVIKCLNNHLWVWHSHILYPIK